MIKRILVTGSRSYVQVGVIRQALEAHGPGLVVHGGARGADLIAAKLAIELGWPTEIHQADWNRGKKAGPLRNQAMVDLGADVCLAFPLGDSIGTWDCVRRARAAGIPVIIF